MVHIFEATDFDPQWRDFYAEFVNQHPDANIYHTLEWHKVIQETYGYTPTYIIVKNDDKTLGVLTLFLVKGFTSKKLISIPYSHWVPILTKNKAILQILLNTAQQICQQKGCASVTLRHGLPISNQQDWHIMLNNHNSCLSFDKVNESELWQSIAGSARRAIKRAKRDSVNITNKTDIEAFYQLMLETRRRQKVPIYPLEFFKNLSCYLTNSKNWTIYLATLNQQIVAGIITLKFGKKTIYGYGASVNNKDVLRSRPVDHLIWHAIQESHQQKAIWFDFGRTPKTHETLLRFKEKWGAKTTDLPYYYWSPTGKQPQGLNRQSKLNQLIGSILCKLPPPVYIWVSTLIMKRLG